MKKVIGTGNFSMQRSIWVKIFKNGPSSICGRQPFKSFTWSTLEYFDPFKTLRNIHDEAFWGK